mmetsp:Transcript_65531/g.154069  ORF Transcript_65531/g.154069 Transcript_65531/m.154069 type:complete len:255 (+) Transcript_65531:42-806(+)
MAVGCPRMEWPDTFSVETLHQEADSIQKWLDARPSPGPETKRLAASREDLAGTLASLEGQISRLRQQLAHEDGKAAFVPATRAEVLPARHPTMAETRAQQDILKLLQSMAAGFQDDEVPESDEVAGAETGLTQLSTRLWELRARYQDMQSRCESFGSRLQEVQSQEETNQRQVLELELLLQQGEAELEQLREEAREVQIRRGAAQREERRLEAAARQDQVTLEQCRLELRRLKARNADLEREVDMLYRAQGPPG